MADSVSLPISITRAISDQTTLFAALRRFVDRSSISDDELNDCIVMAEARFNRVLRVPDMETIATATATSEATTLPTDFLEMRAVYVNGTTRYELVGMSPIEMAAAYGGDTGYPVGYCLAAGQIRLAPIPASSTSLTMVYYAKIEAISENNPDNWLLTDHPDIYMYSVLAATEAYLVNDDRILIWKSAADEALEELKAQGRRARHGSNLAMNANVPQVRGVRA